MNLILNNYKVVVAFLCTSTESCLKNTLDLRICKYLTSKLSYLVVSKNLVRSYFVGIQFLITYYFIQLYLRECESNVLHVLSSSRLHTLTIHGCLSKFD